MQMTSSIVDDSKQRAAKVAGSAYLASFTLVVYNNFGVHDKLNVPGDAAETARRIVENEGLFRLGIMVDMTYAVLFVALLSSLYFILKETSPRLTLLAVFWQLIYVITWVVLTVKFFEALRLMNAPDYLLTIEEGERYAISKLLLAARFDRYYATLMFYSMGSLFFNAVWLRSGFIPKWLAIWGIAACVWCTFCAIAFLLSPDFQKIVNPWLFDLPMAFFDMALSVWLLAKGLRAPVSMAV